VSFIFSLQSTEPEPLFFELVSVINQPKKTVESTVGKKSFHVFVYPGTPQNDFRVSILEEFILKVL